jgi:hypothetical protein
MDTYLLVGRGKAGWHAQGISSGNKFSSSGGTFEHYVSEAPEGCPVYDAENADYDAFAKFTISGPMCDVTLPPGQVNRFSLGDSKKYATERSEHATERSEYSSFDFVPLDIYLNLLRDRVPGVRFGKVVNHTVVWECV